MWFIKGFSSNSLKKGISNNKLLIILIKKKGLLEILIPLLDIKEEILPIGELKLYTSRKAYIVILKKHYSYILNMQSRISKSIIIELSLLFLRYYFLKSILIYNTYLLIRGILSLLKLGITL